MSLLALTAAVAANAQTSSAYGWATLTESWTGGPDIEVAAYNGSFTWSYYHGTGAPFNVGANYSDYKTYITSVNYSSITGSEWDYSGAENVMYWYVYNAGSVAENIDWTFTNENYSETDIDAGYGIDTSFGEVIEDNNDISVEFSVSGSGYGSGSQYVTDTAYYDETLLPGQEDLFIGVTLSRGVLDYNTAVPGPAAFAPFALGLLACRRRRRR